MVLSSLQSISNQAENLDGKWGTTKDSWVERAVIGTSSWIRIVIISHRTWEKDYIPDAGILGVSERILPTVSGRVAQYRRRGKIRYACIKTGGGMMHG